MATSTFVGSTKYSTKAEPAEGADEDPAILRTLRHGRTGGIKKEAVARILPSRKYVPNLAGSQLPHFQSLRSLWSLVWVDNCSSDCEGSSVVPLLMTTGVLRCGQLIRHLSQLAAPSLLETPSSPRTCLLVSIRTKERPRSLFPGGASSLIV